MRVKVHNAQLLILPRYLLLKSKFGNALQQIIHQTPVVLLQIVEIILINSANKKNQSDSSIWSRLSEESHHWKSKIIFELNFDLPWTHVNFNV